MNTNIRAWGNSYGVRLPIWALKESEFNVDDELDVRVSKGEITLIKKSHINMRDYFKPTLTLNNWKFNREELYDDEE